MTSTLTIDSHVRALASSCLDVTPRERDWMALADANGGEPVSYIEVPCCPLCGDYTVWIDGPGVLERADVDLDLTLALAAVARDVADRMDDETERDATAQDIGLWRTFDSRADALESHAEQMEAAGEDSWYAWRCVNPACDEFGREVDPVDAGAEGPIMNYDYPFPDHVRELGESDAEEIASLPLCIVSYDDGTQSLALTGGGMDFTWEIAEAFVRLGFLPPVHFAELPGMGDRGANGGQMSDRDALIVGACKRAVSEHAERVAYRSTRILSRLAQIAGEDAPERTVTVNAESLRLVLDYAQPDEEVDALLNGTDGHVVVPMRALRAELTR